MRHYLALPLLALSAGLAAQGTALTLATDSPVGVFARAGLVQDHKFIPALTPIQSAVGVAAAVTGANAATKISPMTSPALGVIVNEGGLLALPATTPGGSCGTTAATMPPIDQGPHSILMRLANTNSIVSHGRVRVTLNGKSDAGAAALASVDIGNNGSHEFKQAVDGNQHQQTFPVTIQGTLAIQVLTDASARLNAGGRASYLLTLEVEYLPDPPAFVFSRYGDNCGDLVLSGGDTVQNGNHFVTFKQANAFPASPGALWLGDRPLHVQIPGTDCWLNTNVLVNVPFSSNAVGEAVLAFPVLSPVFGTAYAQGISWTLTPNMRFKLSNGLKIECRG